MNTTTNLLREPRLGIDIGRVIIAGTGNPNGDTAFFDGDEAAMLATPPVPDAFAAITELTELFEGRVWLVSKCGRRVQERTLRWLEARDFYRLTGVAPDHMRFCRARVDKRGHCVELGITHFVDDRPDVHAALRDVVEYRYLFGPQREPSADDATPVATWTQARELIVASVAAGRYRPARASDGVQDGNQTSSAG